MTFQIRIIWFDWDEKKMVMYSNQIVSSQKKQNMEKNLNIQVKCIWLLFIWCFATSLNLVNQI